MMRDRRLLLLVLLTFAAAIAGVVIGRVYVVPVRPVENELHDLLVRVGMVDDTGNLFWKIWRHL